MVAGINALSEYLNQVVTSFATPRQGPIDTTNPEAVKARNPSLAATPTDASQPPKPVASKVVQPGSGGASGSFDPMAAFLQQQAAAQEQARRDAMGANLARAGAAIGASLTRSPSARAGLTSMVGGVSSGGGGGSGGAGAGGLSFDAFSNYAKLLDARNRRPQLIKSLAERTGKDPSYYEGMDDTTLNNLGQIAMTPKIEKVTLANGDIVTIDISDPKAMAQLRAVDPDATQKLADERTKTGLDIVKTGTTLETEKRQQATDARTIAAEKLQRDSLKAIAQARPDLNLTNESIDAMSAADASKLAQELVSPETAVRQSAERRALELQPSVVQEKKAEAATKTEEAARQQELRAIMTDPALIEDLAKQGGTDAKTLRAAYAAGKAPEAIYDIIKGTPLYQEWLKTDQKKSFTQWAEEERASKAVQPAPGKGFSEAGVKETVEKIQKFDLAQQRLPDARRRFDMLAKGEGLVGGFYGQPTLQNMLGTMGDLFGYNVKGVTDAQILNNTILDQTVSRAKELGVNPTDNDVKVLKQALGGDLTQTRDALVDIAAMNMRHNIQSMINANEAVEGAKVWAKNDPMAQAYLADKVRAIPDHTSAMFKKEVIDGMIKAATSDASPEDKQATYAAFDAKYGTGMATYLLTKKGVL